MKTYTQKFKVMREIQAGYFETEKGGFDTQEEAWDSLKHYADLFPDNHYHVEAYEAVERVERTYNNNAVDGWEDLYPTLE